MLASHRPPRYNERPFWAGPRREETVLSTNRRFFTALIFAFGLIFASFGPIAFAQEEPRTVEELIKAVETTYAGVNTLRADFVQTTRSPTMGEQKQRGKVTLKRPRMMKWDSTGTGGGLFVSNGQKMWLYNPADKQVLVYSDLSKSGGAEMMDLLDSLDQLAQHFTILTPEGLETKDKKSFQLVLRPKKDSQYKEIKLRLSKRKLEVEELTLVDGFGVETSFAFTQMRMNLDVPDNEFNFVPPAGVEVIDASGL